MTAASACCSYGMQLLSLESQDELLCLSELMNSETEKSDIYCNSNYKFHKKGPHGSGLSDSYFTSGSDQQTSNSFIWCSQSANLTPFGQGVFWDLNQPSTTNFLGVEEDCAAIQLNPGLPQKNSFSDVDCSSNMKYICEVFVTRRIFLGMVLFFVFVKKYV